MGSLKHLLTIPPAPPTATNPDVARVERAHQEGNRWVWELAVERELQGENDWAALLCEIGQRPDPTTPCRARWIDRDGGVRRSAHFPVWERPS